MKRINLSSLRKNYESYDSQREKVIVQARIVLKTSKQLEYALHRGGAFTNLETTLSKEFKKLVAFTKKHERLANEGSFGEASEEYAEAMLYLDYVKRDVLRTPEQLGVTEERYLLALSDLSGELVRRAVAQSTKGNKDAVFEIHAFIENIYKELLAFNFRNGQQRKKFDAIRWNLTKLEDILYDIAIKSK
jgi:predicted translin family RNA/ssDNA-binding protein